MNTTTSHRLFVYGTLRDRGLLFAALGRELDLVLMRPATAPGWRAVTFPGETYPALILSGGSNAEGLVLDGLSAVDLARLDHYEGNQYVRQTLFIACGGIAIEAQAYLPAFEISPDAPDWSFDDWVRIHRTATIREALPPAAHNASVRP